MIRDYADRQPERRERLLRASDDVPVRRSRTPIRRSGQFNRKKPSGKLKRVIASVLAVGLIGAAVLVLTRTIPSSSGTAFQELVPPSTPKVLQLPSVKTEFRPRISHKVRRGETLGTIFSAHGLSMLQASQIHEELKRLSSEEAIPSSIARGQILHLTFSDQGELAELQSHVSKDVQFFLKRTAEDRFVGSVERLPKVNRERVVAGAIETSFAAAANRAGLPYDAIDNLVDLFSDRISFHRDFRKGDRFSVIYQDIVLEDGTSLGAGTILAAALEVDGTAYVAVRYTGADKVSRYFDSEGAVLGNSFLRYPVKFSRISSHFSKSRFHPVLKRRRPHNGVDFAAPTGTPVRSVADGKVLHAGRKGGGGLTVKIQHTSRYSTAYLHLSKIAKGIRRGARVKRGQRIGAVGMTGLATGPHLHYSFYDRGKYVDPMKIKLPKVEELTRDQRIDKLYLKRVLYTLDHYQSINLGDFYWN